MLARRFFSAFLAGTFLLGQGTPSLASSTSTPSTSTLRPERAGAEQIASKLNPTAGAEQKSFADFDAFKARHDKEFINVAKGMEAAKPPDGPYLATALWNRWKGLGEVAGLLKAEKKPKWLSSDRQKVADLLQENIEGIAKDYQLHFVLVSGHEVLARKADDEIINLLDNSPAEAAWVDLMGRTLSADKVRPLAFPKQGRGIVAFILEVQPAKEKTGPVRIVVYKADAHLQGLVHAPKTREQAEHLYTIGMKAHPKSWVYGAIGKAKDQAEQKKRDAEAKKGTSGGSPSADTSELLDAELGKALLVDPVIRAPANELPAARRRWWWETRQNGKTWKLKTVVNFLVRRLHRPGQEKEIEAALAKAENIRPGQPFAEEADAIALMAEVRAQPDLERKVKTLQPKQAAHLILPAIDRNEKPGGDLAKALEGIIPHVLKEPKSKDEQFAKALWLEFEQKSPPAVSMLEKALLAGNPKDWRIARLRWRNLPDRDGVKQEAVNLLVKAYQESEANLSAWLDRAGLVPAQFAFITMNDARAVAQFILPMLQESIQTQLTDRPAVEIAREILPLLDPGLDVESPLGKTWLSILEEAAKWIQQSKDENQLSAVLWRAAPETFKKPSVRIGGRIYDVNGQAFLISEADTTKGSEAVIVHKVVNGQPVEEKTRITPKELIRDGWRYDPPSQPTAAGAEGSGLQELFVFGSDQDQVHRLHQAILKFRPHIQVHSGTTLPRIAQIFGKFDLIPDAVIIVGKDTVELKKHLEGEGRLVQQVLGVSSADDEAVTEFLTGIFDNLEEAVTTTVEQSLPLTQESIGSIQRGTVVLPTPSRIAIRWKVEEVDTKLAGEVQGITYSDQPIPGLISKAYHSRYKYIRAENLFEHYPEARFLPVPTWTPAGAEEDSLHRERLVALKGSGQVEEYLWDLWARTPAWNPQAFFQRWFREEAQWYRLDTDQAIKIYWWLLDFGHRPDALPAQRQELRRFFLEAARRAGEWTGARTMAADASVSFPGQELREKEEILALIQGLWEESLAWQDARANGREGFQGALLRTAVRLDLPAAEQWVADRLRESGISPRSFEYLFEDGLVFPRALRELKAYLLRAQSEKAPRFSLQFVFGDNKKGTRRGRSQKDVSVLSGELLTADNARLELSKVVNTSPSGGVRIERAGENWKKGLRVVPAIGPRDPVPWKRALETIRNARRFRGMTHVFFYPAGRSEGSLQAVDAADERAIAEKLARMGAESGRVRLRKYGNKMLVNFSPPDDADALAAGAEEAMYLNAEPPKAEQEPSATLHINGAPLPAGSQWLKAGDVLSFEFPIAAGTEQEDRLPLLERLNWLSTMYLTKRRDSALPKIYVEGQETALSRGDALRRLGTVKGLFLAALSLDRLSLGQGADWGVEGLAAHRSLLQVAVEPGLPEPAADPEWSILSPARALDQIRRLAGEGDPSRTIHYVEFDPGRQAPRIVRRISGLGEAEDLEAVRQGKFLGALSPSGGFFLLGGHDLKGLSASLWYRELENRADSDQAAGVEQKLMDYLRALDMVEKASTPVLAGFRYGASVIGGGASQGDWDRLGQARWQFTLALKGVGFDTAQRVNDEFLRLVGERGMPLADAEKGHIWGAAVGAFNPSAGAEEEWRETLNKRNLVLQIPEDRLKRTVLIGVLTNRKELLQAGGSLVSLEDPGAPEYEINEIKGRVVYVDAITSPAARSKRGPRIFKFSDLDGYAYIPPAAGMEATVVSETVQALEELDRVGKFWGEPNLSRLTRRPILIDATDDIRLKHLAYALSIIMAKDLMAELDFRIVVPEDRVSELMDELSEVNTAAAAHFLDARVVSYEGGEFERHTARVRALSALADSLGFKSGLALDQVFFVDTLTPELALKLRVYFEEGSLNFVSEEAFRRLEALLEAA